MTVPNPKSYLKPGMIASLTWRAFKTLQFPPCLLAPSLRILLHLATTRFSLPR